MRHFGIVRRSVMTLLAASVLAAVPAARGGIAMAADPAPLTVFAASSLTEALNQINALWQSNGHQGVRFSFGSSGALAKQIDQGAGADLFLSADQKWMDWLAQRDQLLKTTRRDLVANRLVLVERKATLKPITLAPGADLAGLLHGDGRLAVGEPASVPAGIYAQQALTRLGLWDSVKNHLAPAENVRSALLLVEHGEAPAGIVYATDVKVAPYLAVAGVFPESSHTPIVYPGAVLKQARAPERAKQFLEFLGGGAAQAVFHNLGFSKPPAPSK